MARFARWLLATARGKPPVDGADEADDGCVVGECADSVGVALDLAVETLNRVGAVRLRAVRGGEVHLGQDVLLALSIGADSDQSGSYPAAVK